MEERMQSMPGEAPPRPNGEPGTTGAQATDPHTLQILSTEHWSLLAARGLVYNEAFSRAGMYLSFLSATLVALGLIATATGFSDGFLLIAAVLLALDVFIGYATLGRIAGASGEDILLLQAMNRIRHAYVDISPGVAPYFAMGYHDDPESVLAIYGPIVASPVQQMLHGFTTTPGMIGTINAAVGAVLTAVLTMLATHNPTMAGVVAVATFVVLFILTTVISVRSVAAFWRRMKVLFPKDR